ncbi:cupin domain-containing protein [Streptomyces sp. NPDC000345]|uniref:cupin domain-containing protein n=1 Tax=Streptomyces sp. NPDC000345 TaxID=3364537 RepID=UPI00369AAD2F
MIISTTAEAVRTTVATGSGTDAAAAWTCLVRRGMLHSECEAVEHWLLPHGAVLTATPRHGVEEALLVLDGRLLVTTASGERAVRAGQLALIPHGCQARLVADSDAVRLITVRTLATSVTDRLPPRIPELVSA